MKRVKIVFKAALCVAFCLTLCGCSLLEFNTSQNLLPPAATGDEEAIQSALETYISGEYGSAAAGQYKLKYPHSGDYRTAFVVKDTDGDNVAEALAFYTLSDEQPLAHVNYLRKQGKEWESVADIESESADIREVRFSDLDGDGRLELLIGYEIAIARDSRLCLYRLSPIAMTELGAYWYTDFLVSRVVSEAQNDVTIFHISNSEYVVEATLISMQNGEMKTRGKTFIDGYIEKFAAIDSCRFEDGTTGIFADCEKENDTLITELLWWDGKHLQAPLYDPYANVTVKSARTSGLSFCDVDGDGAFEWPVCEELPLPESQNGEPLWLTRWCSYDTAAEEDVTEFYSVTVPQDGYLLRLDNAWLGAVAAAYDKSAHRLDLFYTQDGKETLECVIRNSSAEDATPVETATGAVGQPAPLVYKTVSLKGSGADYRVWWNDQKDAALKLDLNDILYRMTVLS